MSQDGGDMKSLRSAPGKETSISIVLPTLDVLRHSPIPLTRKMYWYIYAHPGSTSYDAALAAGVTVKRAGRALKSLAYRKIIKRWKVRDPRTGRQTWRHHVPPRIYVADEVCLND